MFEKFCYDALNRLTASATAASTPAACTAAGAGIVSKSVSYDAVGNITAKSDVGTYAYPTPGPGSVRPHAVSAIAGTVNGVANPSYSYDANGNLTGGAGRSIAYSSFNRTRSIAQGGTADCLAYDTEHNRLRMDSYAAAACSGTPSASTTYLNDPVSGMGSEKVVAGAVTTWHDYLTVDGALVGERSCSGAAPCSSGASWLYFVSDHLGSIAVITDGSGAVAQRLSYDAWGRRRNADGSDNPGCTITAVTSRGYTGHEMLDSVCQVNANARLYDPTIARFLSPDGIVPNPFGSQSLNRYAYVENGPLSATDPSGNGEIVIVRPPPIVSDDDGGPLQHGPPIPDSGHGSMASGGMIGTLAYLYDRYRQRELAAQTAQWLHASMINASDEDAAHQAANQVKALIQALNGMDAQVYDTSPGAGIGGNSQGENTEAAAYTNSSDMEETYQQYNAHIRAAGIDPNSTSVPPSQKQAIDAITASEGFTNAANSIYSQSVAVGRETGGIQVYRESDGSIQIEPYEGTPAVCSAAAVSCMNAPNPDPSKGTLLFEWHPHPIGQPGSDLPSEANLNRSLRYNVPGVIWSMDGSTHNQIDYLAHPLQ
ncbi:MAG: RHS repeat-associated core domain-containing protein [Rhizomicrobium sp.]